MSNSKGSSANQNEISEAIILAGGFGTRLRSAVPELPKSLAPVAGRPFLYYVINYLRSQGIRRFVFSLGYRHEDIEDFLTNEFATLDYGVVIEKEPFGTGGAVAFALTKCISSNVVVTNGDTLFKVNIPLLNKFHGEHRAHCTLALKPMSDFDRYGVVEIDERNKVTSFLEKKYYSSGLINGGLYVLNKDAFIQSNRMEKFSFEKDFLEEKYADGNIIGVVQDEYFIDIGIPSDFEKAQDELGSDRLDLKKVGTDWTLFIDRDGVINEEKKDDYIRNWGEFKFYSGVFDAFKIFSKKFRKVIIISNQRGVGRKLMTEDILQDIHEKMMREIESNGGRIDRIYYCTSTDDRDICRKPNPGMAFLAAKDFPEIDLRKSIMIGNKPSDMRFGKYAGMHTVFLRTTNPDVPFPHSDIDLAYDSLVDFAKAL